MPSEQPRRGIPRGDGAILDPETRQPGEEPLAARLSTSSSTGRPDRSAVSTISDARPASIFAQLTRMPICSPGPNAGVATAGEIAAASTTAAEHDRGG